MWLRRMTCMVLMCVIFLGMIAIPVNAVEVTKISEEPFAEKLVMPLATNSFSMSIPAQKDAEANSSFSLAVGETVTIKATYSPFSANLDFGVIAPDGNFYYFSTTGGSIDKTLQVSMSGKYTLQVRNNSNYEVKVSGFVNY